MMKATGKYVMGAMLTMVMVVGSQSAMAEDDYANDTARPSGGAMVADALLARPLLAAATIGGAAVFLVSLPFSALGGNVDAAAETLIKTPAEATFRRCLGCEMSRRADDSTRY
ncbi:hypothetical protein [Halomonas maura]|uniref:hypothetical protein n=1 Tax=Halomonas maura TaxID=117606 RepID=UPI0025B4512E|nr:hypothetical protein [Halomonas maura]MDN3554566.1 hypothetical protein [Halomonas maura]